MYAAQQSPLHLPCCHQHLHSGYLTPVFHRQTTTVFPHDGRLLDPVIPGLSSFLTHSCNQSRLVLLKRQQCSALHDEADSLVYVWVAVQEWSHPIWLAKMHWLRKPATCQQACMLLLLLLLSQMLLQPLSQAHLLSLRHLKQSVPGK